MAEPLTENQVTRMAWKGLLLDARSNPENPEEEHAPLGEDEAYVTSLTSDCIRWAYYQDKLPTSGTMNLTSVFKTSIGTLVHRAKFFENTIMEQRVNHEGIRGRIDGYDPNRKIIYEVKTTESDKIKYAKPNEHHVQQVLIYWALKYKMVGEVARQAFLLYVVFPRQRIVAFEVKLPKKRNQTDEEALEEIWQSTIRRKNLLCACRKAVIPPEPTWGTWNTDYCNFNEQCILDSPYFETHCSAKGEPDDEVDQS
jgi:hypothetical protein